MNADEHTDPGCSDDRDADHGHGDDHGRDIDAEFTRLMAEEGLFQDPEPDPGPDPDDATGTEPATAPDPEPEIAEGQELLTDDDAVLGDFVPPDPDLPTATDAAVWSWTALIAGLVALVLAATSVVPGWLAAVGGAAAVGGLVALLARVPHSRDDGDDGAQV